MILFQICGDFSVLEIKFSVMFSYFPQHLAGISDSNRICGNILGDNASRTDDGIVTDSDSGDNDSSRTYPAVSADVYGDIVLIYLFAKRRKYRILPMKATPFTQRQLSKT